MKVKLYGTMEQLPTSDMAAAYSPTHEKLIHRLT